MSEQAKKQTADAGTPDGKIKAVNKLLLDAEPGDVSIDSYGGYAGYKPQFIVDAMNAVFGIGGWGFDELSEEIVTTQTEKGTSTLAVAQVRVWIRDIVSLPVGWGQARVTKGDVGDAKKGAQTDALKKALSYFSIGNRAYHGLLSARQHS
ncbi:MAG TPA: Rad52/Rad22 family DNA repair protein [Ktedonobacteraceae bacterium]|nr:Rad52/Rad22 family DNA repair protein [Ktedonobacteraceae bacterium]